MQFSFVSLCLVLAIFSLSVVAGNMLQRGSSNTITDRFLVAFLIATVLALGNFLYVSSGVIVSAPQFGFIANTVGLCAAPLLYFYARSLADTDFEFEPRMLTHFTPVLFFLLVVIVSYSVKARDVKLQILTDASFPNPINSVLLPLVIFGFVAAYLFLTVNLLLKHCARFDDFHASKGMSDLGWLRISVIGACIIWSSSLFHTVAVAMWPLSWLDGLFTALIAASAFGFALYFLVQALKQSGKPALAVPMTGQPYTKYGSQRISDEQVAQFAASLEACFATEQPFLRPTLSLDELAKELPMTGRELSQTINRQYGQSFFDLINERRIQYAKKQLIEDQQASITEIMLASGYHSKSSFYTAFRKETGQTPSAFRAAASKQA